MKITPEIHGANKVAAPARARPERAVRAAIFLAAMACAPAQAQPLPINPAITQATTGETICRAGWTRTIRPPTGHMRHIKRHMLAEIGEPDSHGRRYELDHKIPLTLGGAATNPRNLTLEPLAEARKKNAVESCLSSAVCQGRTTLDEAQLAIWTDWRAAAALCERAHP
jgi:hypothetical protein